MPASRNLNARFLQDFLAGKKSLLLTKDVKFVKAQYNFKELSLEKLLNDFPDHDLARKFLPDSSSVSKIDRSYALNAT